MGFYIYFIYMIVKKNQRIIHCKSIELRRKKIFNIILYLEEIEFRKIFLMEINRNDIWILLYKTELKKVMI